MTITRRCFGSIQRLCPPYRNMTRQYNVILYQIILFIPTIIWNTTHITLIQHIIWSYLHVHTRNLSGALCPTNKKRLYCFSYSILRQFTKNEIHSRWTVKPILKKYYTKQLHERLKITTYKETYHETTSQNRCFNDSIMSICVHHPESRY